ncbi:hypothetical protein EFA69_15885 [Rufibacter immobilis]|uniref:Outer membrane protein assembly factor BamE n=1 Tax=Rufibacter immobilis TaxID=1348778 RepID=A0A3M9MQ10_9BACT|nr:hypothetical protein [Rufibacter immobilis]RNI27599.1 hypothetical protein EFA69_15885 [Rufibacter immobilis]
MVLLQSFSCSSGENKFGFDAVSWKNDLNGCKGTRVQQKAKVEEIRLQLLGLNEREIRKLFGKPDSEELMERSNKVYIYFITPGPKCEQATQATTKTALTVRMDALGVVREANIFEE